MQVIIVAPFIHSSVDVKGLAIFMCGITAATRVMSAAFCAHVFVGMYVLCARVCKTPILRVSSMDFG